MKKPSKKATITALLIGILGSAIWEKILSPLCTFIYIKLSSLIDKFQTSFSNKTYQEISKGYNDSALIDITYYLLLIFFLISFIFFYIYIMRKNFNIITTDLKIINTDLEIRNTENSYKRMRKRHLISFSIMALFQFLMIMFMYWVGNLTFINNCKTSSLCNLEIVCPYISDLEYKELKSTFYSIQTKEDYDSFTNIIEKIGERYNLNLKQ